MVLDVKKVKWKARRTTAIFYGVSGIISGTWASRIPEMQQKFHLTDARWGGVLFAIPVGLFIGLPVSSWIVSKYTSYRMMSLSAVIYALLISLLPFAPNVWMLTFSLFLFGISRNLFNISINTNSVEIQRFYSRPIITTFHGIWSLACLIAAGIGTVIIWGKIEPSYHFILITVLSLIIIAIFRFKRSAVSKSAGTRRPFFVKPDKYLFLLGVMCFFTMICEGTMFDWSVSYFDRVVKPAKALSTAGYTSFIASMTIARFVGDKLIAFFGPIKMLVINGLSIALGFSIAVFFPYVWSASVGFLLIGFGDSILVPTIYSLAGRTEKMPPSYAIAAVTLIGYIGFISAPLIVGSISEAFGMRYSFALMIIFSACISIIAYSLKDKVAALTK